MWPPRPRPPATPPKTLPKTLRPERAAKPASSKRRGTVREVLRVLGPGLVTGAADDDPSGIGTYAQAGAGFGFAQLWLVLYMLPLMIAVQEMCGRIGLVTRQGVAGVVRKHYSRGVLYPVVALVFIANTFNLGADLGGMAAATRLLVPMVPFAIMVILFGTVILALEIYVPYRQYARVLKFLALALLAYVFTALIIRPDWGHILRATLLPQIQPTSAYLLLVVGLLGTTISPYLFFWQASEEVEEFNEQAADEGISAHNAMPTLERRRLRWGLMLRQLNRLKADTVIGMTVSESVAWFIMITTGGTLFTHGMTNITSADQAAAALVPLVKGFPHAGQLASLIFALGIVGAGLLAVPTLAGSAAYATAEAFGWREGLSRTLRLAPGLLRHHRRLDGDWHRAEPHWCQPHSGACLRCGAQRHSGGAAAGVTPAHLQQPHDHGRTYQQPALQRHQPLRHRRHGGGCCRHYRLNCAP